jgi:hypothetical protein
VLSVPATMPITGPELGDGIALSIGIDLAVIFQTRWKASYLWPGSPTPSIADSTDSLDSLADEKQAAATADVSSTAAYDRQSRGSVAEAALGGQQQLARMLDSPLLPTAALAGAAAACSKRFLCYAASSVLLCLLHVPAAPLATSIAVPA